MKITLNGEAADLPPGSAVAVLAPCAGSAVAVNGSVVPRSAHATRHLEDGDVVEVVTAVQGG
ncbi:MULTISPECIES: sulfur carrier protein ThiS [unclassified Nocardioides]|uniref:sulfur carrier protein ThiS n=1 Tax=unclassified Nocardioides TaxID=2615069 RepID=UPI0006FBE4BE|nr:MULTISPECIES: sulfur carrier protein ThiS [unclassified Nocardioides]KQY56384.1 thiamine biosynthesis protein ThiS [Nocardioides sp. Root140]KRF14247.1 thiamine biosynthesis protein ThiS [Nocardioides sp. Soil796]